MKLGWVAGWSVFGAACTTAAVAALTAHPLPAPKVLDEDGRRQAFGILSNEEATMRRQAAKDWPADPWSQDDAFHNLEHGRAWGLAGAMHTSEAEVLRALDDGMREGWPRYGANMKTTVPPCRPRPITD